MVYRRDCIGNEGGVYFIVIIFIKYDGYIFLITKKGVKISNIRF